MEQSKLNEMLELHLKWLKGESGGVILNLRGANLRDADLRGANLCNANLYGANLRGADLSGVKCNELTAFFSLSCPDEGSFIGFKKLRDDKIAKLLIPEHANRSSATTLKCRASEAVVLAIYDTEGNQVDSGMSKYDSSFTYKVGETVKPTQPFDNDRWNECGSGIHFFMSRAVAEQY